MIVYGGGPRAEYVIRILHKFYRNSQIGASVQEIERRRNERPDVRAKQRELAVRCAPWLFHLLAASLLQRAQRGALL
jgi:hypothetical protein